MPDEIFVEVLKDFAANFYDISRSENQQEKDALQLDYLTQNAIANAQPSLQHTVSISILKNNNDSKQQSEQPDALTVPVGYKPGDDLRLRLHDVIIFLKQQGYAIENTFISFYSAIFSAYVNCNLDPVSKTIWLSNEDLEIIDG